jgi:hypothetical protein
LLAGLKEWLKEWLRERLRALLKESLGEGVDWARPGNTSVVFTPNAAASCDESTVGGENTGVGSGASVVGAVFGKVIGERAGVAPALAKDASRSLRKPAGMAAPWLASALRCAPGSFKPSIRRASVCDPTCGAVPAGATVRLTCIAMLLSSALTPWLSKLSACPLATLDALNPVLDGAGGAICA